MIQCLTDVSAPCVVLPLNPIVNVVNVSCINIGISDDIAVGERLRSGPEFALKVQSRNLYGGAGKLLLAPRSDGF